MAIQITCEQVKGAPAIHFRKGGHPHYKVRIYLIADNPTELDNVSFVQYELHPSFKDRHRSTSDRSSAFEIMIRTYGYFDVQAILNLKDGSREEISGIVEF